MEVCKGLVQRTWRGMLKAISQLLQRSTGEELVLQLLKVRLCTGRICAGLGCCAFMRMPVDLESGNSAVNLVLLPPSPPLHRKQGYQTFTQACGNLPLLEPRDAFLANLCEFALAVPRELGSEADSLSPRGGPQDKLASPRSALVIAAEAAESGLVLAPKNVQSMRTLFNIAHRLSNVLGPAWGLVLETMNTLVRHRG